MGPDILHKYPQTLVGSCTEYIALKGGADSGFLDDESDGSEPDRVQVILLAKTDALGYSSVLHTAAKLPSSSKVQVKGQSVDLIDLSQVIGSKELRIGLDVLYHERAIAADNLDTALKCADALGIPALTRICSSLLKSKILGLKSVQSRLSRRLESTHLPLNYNHVSTVRFLNSPGEELARKVVSGFVFQEGEMRGMRDEMREGLRAIELAARYGLLDVMGALFIGE